MFDPWSGKTPRAAEQPRLLATTTELESLHAAATEACAP